MCLADEEDERRARAAAEAEGPEMFAEAAAAVFGEPDPHFMVEQEVAEAVNVQQVAGDDHPPVHSRMLSKVQEVVSRVMEHRLLPCLWRRGVYV